MQQEETITLEISVLDHKVLQVETILTLSHYQVIKTSTYLTLYLFQALQEHLILHKQTQLFHQLKVEVIVQQQQIFLTTVHLQQMLQLLLIQLIVLTELLTGLGYRHSQLQVKMYGFQHQLLFLEYMHLQMELLHHGSHLLV